MYYITNQNNQIIAIDPDLLTYLEVENIDDLYRNIALGDIHFSLLKEENKVTITKIQNKKTYDVKNTDLTGLLGNITLVQIQTLPDISTLMDDNLLTFSLVEEDETPSIAEDKNESVEGLLPLDVTQEKEIPLFDGAPDPIKETSVLNDLEEENDDVLYNLLLPSVAEETIDKITIAQELKTDEKSLAPIVIDVKNISQSIGISTEDYKTFLNEYINTALSLEKDLQSSDQEKRSHAVGVLSHLSNVLRLPIVSEIITQMGNATKENQGTQIESFYTTIGRLTTSPIDSDTKDATLDSSDEQDIDMDGKALFALQNEFTPTPDKGFGNIHLDDVKPIHFDFQLKQAASELSLPLELIEEFVRDFIKLGHTDTKKMLEAYEKGDLDTIHKIGHLLKGTSSNLRIGALSDTLYEIQLCEDINKLEELIKRYWGHFLSLETQINIQGK